QRFEAVTARFFRIRFPAAGRAQGRLELAEVELSPVERVGNVDAKAGYVRGGALDPDVPASDGARGADASATIAMGGVLDLTARMEAGGRFVWDVPAGEWTIVRFGHTPTGKENHPATPEGRGPECDKLSREALDAHWAGMMGPLVADAGPLVGKSLNNSLVDSYEVGCQNWTPRFREEFRRRRGYDLLPFLPALTGRVVENLEETERFLWDFRRTLADLFAENYFGYFAEICRRNGLLASVEPYGNGNFSEMEAGAPFDIPMGEFWVGSSGENSSCKLAASVAHLYGRKFAGAEAFTATAERGRWLQDPASLKALGDAIFCSGVNRFIFHRYAHQPWLDRFPGMTMGPWGFNFERTNTWWEQGAAWLRYVARCQYLLQEGLFAADVLFYSGESAPAAFPYRPQLKAKGYDYDGCDTHTLLNRLSVRDFRLVLPHGMRYRVLVLPDTPWMTPAVARRVRDLVREGATVVGPKPQRSPSRAGQPQSDAEVRRVAEEVWGNCDGKEVREHRYGKGKVV
ncbi:MAG: glycosyl hydrolase, partial [Armatimonadota bacterium]|nr:glycosyl hydrolase [Armatimonadota bacterium]